MAKGPIFQHRHYKAIAALIAGQRPTWGSYVAEHYADEFSRMFASDNPRFDRERFLAAVSGKPSNGRDKVKGPLWEYRKELRKAGAS